MIVVVKVVVDVQIVCIKKITLLNTNNLKL